MLVEVSKHLLAPLKSLVFIKDNRNRFFFQALVFGNRCLNGRLSMLSIVDQEGSGHIDFQKACILIAVSRDKLHVTVHRCSQS